MKAIDTVIDEEWCDIFEKGRKAGIKEVVDWIEYKGKPFYGDNLIIFEMTYDDLREIKQRAAINEIV